MVDELKIVSGASRGHFVERLTVAGSSSRSIFICSAAIEDRKDFETDSIVNYEFAVLRSLEVLQRMVEVRCKQLI